MVRKCSKIASKWYQHHFFSLSTLLVINDLCIQLEISYIGLRRWWGGGKKFVQAVSQEP